MQSSYSNISDSFHTKWTIHLSGDSTPRQFLVLKAVPCNPCLIHPPSKGLVRGRTMNKETDHAAVALWVNVVLWSRQDATMYFFASQTHLRTKYISCYRNVICLLVCLFCCCCCFFFLFIFYLTCRSVWTHLHRQNISRPVSSPPNVFRLFL